MHFSDHLGVRDNTPKDDICQALDAIEMGQSQKSPVAVQERRRYRVNSRRACKNRKSERVRRRREIDVARI